MKGQGKTLSYLVKACFRTIQGEGAQAGRIAVFCRFSGCNLWSGREKDRAEAVCQFCDTDFVGTNGEGGGKFTCAELIDHILTTWGSDTQPYVVFTGGEPLLQLDCELIEACISAGFELAIETNGTLSCPPGIDWICVSPKAGTQLVQKSGDELKLVYPQGDLDPEDYAQLEFRVLSLQPRDGVDRDEATRRCIDYCLAHPRWRLSVQLHKQLGID